MTRRPVAPEITTSPREMEGIPAKVPVRTTNSPSDEDNPYEDEEGDESSAEAALLENDES